MKNIFTFLLFSFFLISSCEDPAVSNEPGDKTSTIVKQDSTKPTQRRKSPIDSLNAILIKDPNNSEAYLSRAEKFLSIKSFRAAAADIYNAMQIDSNSAKARNLKGQLNYIQNKSGQAKKEWEACVKIDPDNIECRMRICELYIAVHDYERALVLTDEAIKIDPNANIPYFYKGMIIRDTQQDTALALQYFQKSVDLKPNFIEGLDMMGVTLASIGDTFAKYYYQRILDIQPNRDDIYYKLGVYYMNRNEINLALENYFEVIRINPKNADAFYSIGFIHIQLKQLSEARDYFSKAIQYQVHNYKAYYGRAYCLEQLGDINNARNDYRMALDANPVYDPAKIGLARVNAAINGSKG